MRSPTSRIAFAITGAALVAGLTACYPLQNSRPGIFPAPGGNVSAPEWFSCGAGPSGLAVKAYGMNDDPGVCGRAMEAAWAYSHQYPDWNHRGYQVPVTTRTAGTWDCGEIATDPTPYQECTLRGSPVDVLRLLS
ncbi:hypothetical protein GPX89_28445 [Nocardia sp. ET3-3]|uniref:Uncharacterized protein n=1 Tax=Nocardia terrae TaxID=2675851 RepID=A0A7K1V3U1_9NOCA|nr:hypothetical protein [Nocardia terrae]MVU81162.1 hypothetical protein [Nocardia terrae]